MQRRERQSCRYPSGLQPGSQHVGEAFGQKFDVREQPMMLKTQIDTFKKYMIDDFEMFVVIDASEEDITQDGLHSRKHEVHHIAIWQESSEVRGKGGGGKERMRESWSGQDEIGTLHNSSFRHMASWMHGAVRGAMCWWGGRESKPTGRRHEDRKEAKRGVRNKEGE
eukprot:766545-Hanusia_phi.AAC.6